MRNPLGITTAALVAILLSALHLTEPWPSSAATRDSAAENPLLIRCNPDPPVPGQEVEVCYDFPKDSGPVTLEVEWVLQNGSVQTQLLHLSPEDPCEKVKCPATAAAVVIEDQSGQSAAYSDMLPIDID